MTIELPAGVEKDLQNLAFAQDRTIGELVEDAVRQYLEAAAITDLGAAEVAQTQAAMVGELRDLEEWKDGRG
jgi:predicted transcriptional regulator